MDVSRVGIGVSCIGMGVYVGMGVSCVGMDVSHVGMDVSCVAIDVTHGEVWMCHV